MKNNFYNKQLKINARNLRKEMTRAEASLWKYVLRASTTGYPFRRQRPILNYIVDFVCLPLKLIIEVDGYSHLLDEVKEKDEKRQKKLEDAGFKVIRFTDEEVLTEIDNVRAVIECELQELAKSSPQPPPKGEIDNVKKRINISKRGDART
jgi:very-short-patch-repair endonuclease